MSSNSFGFGYVGVVTETPNEAGGTTLTIDNAFTSDKVDWSNEDNVKIAASKAMKMAEGFYDLIQRNCNFEDPVFSNENIEILIAIGAFACELFLKSIVYMENGHGGKEIRSHNLHDLIDMLATETKNKLYSYNADFDSKVVELADTFTEMRYMFEFNAFNKEYLLIFDLLDALKSISKDYRKTEMAVIRYSGGMIKIE